jgi:hypothetical protein
MVPGQKWLGHLGIAVLEELGCPPGCPGQLFGGEPPPLFSAGRLQHSWGLKAVSAAHSYIEGEA